jgi:hypothetical protein
MSDPTLISISVLAFFPVCGLFLLARRHVLLTRLGAREIGFRRGARIQFIGIAVCAPVLASLGLLLRADLLLVAILSASSVVSFSLALSGVLLGGIEGLYANGIVLNTSVVFWKEVVAFRRLDPYIIELTYSSRAGRMLVFPDSNLVLPVLERLDGASPHLP